MSDAVNPSHYKAGWSDDAELISITENLTGNGSQAVQYIARSSRLDESLNKSSDVDGRVEDLEKALWFVGREILRLKAAKLRLATPKSYGSGGLVTGIPSEAVWVNDLQGKPVVNRDVLRQMDQKRAAFDAR